MGSPRKSTASTLIHWTQSFMSHITSVLKPCVRQTPLWTTTIHHIHKRTSNKKSHKTECTFSWFLFSLLCKKLDVFQVKIMQMSYFKSFTRTILCGWKGDELVDTSCMSQHENFSRHFQHMSVMTKEGYSENVLQQIIYLLSACPGCLWSSPLEDQLPFYPLSDVHCIKLFNLWLG